MRCVPVCRLVWAVFLSSVRTCGVSLHVGIRVHVLAWMCSFLSLLALWLCMQACVDFSCPCLWLRGAWNCMLAGASSLLFCAVASVCSYFSVTSILIVYCWLSPCQTMQVLVCVSSLACASRTSSAVATVAMAM